MFSSAVKRRIDKSQVVVMETCVKKLNASLRLVKPICEKFKSLKGLFIIESAISLSSYPPPPSPSFP